MKIWNVMRINCSHFDRNTLQLGWTIVSYMYYSSVLFFSLKKNIIVEPIRDLVNKRCCDSTTLISHIDKKYKHKKKSNKEPNPTRYHGLIYFVPFRHIGMSSTCVLTSFAFHHICHFLYFTQQAWFSLFSSFFPSHSHVHIPPPSTLTKHHLLTKRL